MANITATGSFSNIAVTSSLSNITVTDTASNITVTNVATVSANVGVTSTLTNVTVTGLAEVSNATIRNALSVNDTGGDGSLTYSNATGIFTYTGPSASEVRAHLFATDAGGDGSFSYDNGSGVFTYTGPNQTEANARIAAAPSQVRSHLSNTSPITYDSSTGVIGLEQTLDDLTLLKWQETVVENGNVSGNVSFDISAGTIHKATVVGNITNITFANISSGGSAAVMLQQDGIGAWDIDATLFTDWLWVGDYKTLNATPNSNTLISVTYDGTDYKASLVRFDDYAANVEAVINSVVNKAYVDALGVDAATLDGNVASYYLDYNNFTNTPTIPATTDDLPEGSANLYYTTARANSAITTYFGDNANSPFTINGNLQVQGNIDYVNVEDLLVNDQSITLNFGNATARDAFIYVDRSGSVLNNAHIKWNETSDQWEIYDGTSTYVIPRSTSDLAEGTNLYWTTDRGNTNSDAWITTKTTTDLAEGTNLYFSNTNLATSSTTHLPEGTNLYYTDARVDSHLSGGYGITYTSGVIETTNAEIQAQANVAFGNNTTDNLTEGATNLYYSDSKVDTHLNTGTASSGEVLSWTGSDYDWVAQTGGYSNANVADYLLDTGIQKKAHTVFVQDLALSPDAANAQLGFYFPNGSGTTGQVLKFDSATQLTQAFLDTGNVTESTNLYYTTARANSAIDAYVTGGNAITVSSGVVSLDNTAVTPKTYGDATNVAQITVDQQGRITGVSNVAISGGGGTYGNANVQNFLENGYSAANIDANDIVAVTFTGDGSDLTDVRAESVEVTLKNNTGTQIDKGYPVHAIDYSGSGEVICILADAGNAETMPAHFIAQDNLTASGGTGRGILAGRIQNVDTSSFSIGDTIYVAVGGGYANVAPSGEANVIQNLGVVTRIDASAGGGEVMGAGRAAATPALNTGNIFIGDAQNNSSTATLDTSIVPENGNLYYTDARVQSNTAADTGLVHTTGDETVGGDKTFTDLINVVPSGSTDGITITNENSSTPFILQSNSAGGVRLIWTQANDSADGGDITAFKSRGSLTTPTATEFGDSVFDFLARPSTTNNNKTGVGFGFDVEHTTATANAEGGAVNTVFTQTSQDNLFVDNRAYYTSKGSFKIGPGVVDINSDQLRNRGDTVIGNGGDTNYISFADTEAKLIFDKSNVSSTNNVSIKINSWSNRNLWTIGFSGFTPGSFGYEMGNAQSVLIAIDRIGSEYNGDKYLPDGLAVTVGGTISGEGANASGQTYYVRKWLDDGPVTGDNANNVYYELYTDSALTTPLTYNDLVPSPAFYKFLLNLGGYINYATKPAQGNVFVDSYTTTGSGTGSKFQVNRYNGSYNAIGFTANPFGYGGIYNPNAGTGHVVGDTITISGANLKGIATTNDLTFTVDSVDGSGGITSIGNITGTAYQITDQEWSFEMDQTTDNLYVKDDGITKFTFTPNGVALKQFNETVVALGNQSGNVSANIDAVNGSIFTMTAVGNVTINTIPNAQAGSSYTLKITQDGTGSRTLSSSFKYLQGNSTLSTGAGNIDVISVVYDGTDYLASLTHDYK